MPIRSPTSVTCVASHWSPGAARSTRGASSSIGNSRVLKQSVEWLRPVIARAEARPRPPCRPEGRSYIRVLLGRTRAEGALQGVQSMTSTTPIRSFNTLLDVRHHKYDRRRQKRQHIEHAVPRTPIRPQKVPVADLVRDPHREHRREAGPDHGVEQPTAPRRRCRLVLVHRAPKMRRAPPGARETRYFKRRAASLRNDPPPHAGQPIGTADGPR